MGSHLTWVKLPPSRGHACRYPYPWPSELVPNMNKNTFPWPCMQISSKMFTQFKYAIPYPKYPWPELAPNTSKTPSLPPVVIHADNPYPWPPKLVPNINKNTFPWPCMHISPTMLTQFKYAIHYPKYPWPELAPNTSKTPSLPPVVIHVDNPYPWPPKLAPNMNKNTFPWPCMHISPTMLTQFKYAIPYPKYPWPELAPNTSKTPSLPLQIIPTLDHLSSHLTWIKIPSHGHACTYPQQC